MIEFAVWIALASSAVTAMIVGATGLRRTWREIRKPIR